MNKKLLLIALIAMSLLIVSCSSTTEPIQVNESNESTEETEDEEKIEETEVEEVSSTFEFTYQDMAIPLDVKAEPILKKLGESIDYFEAKSCAFPGLDKMYTYPGIEIRTYENDGVDHIIAIILLDDTVATKDGIRLFSTLDAVQAVYGEADTVDNGLHTYIKEDTSLNFLIKDNEVISIEYLALVAEE